MGIPGFSQPSFLSFLLAPVQSLVARFVPQHRGAGVVRRSPCLSARTAPAHPARLVRPVASRLRVVREFDAGVSPACAGRMVISGRMADVCAELDRMAQCEAAAP